MIATCKHFAAYDLERWQGVVRYGFNAVVSSQDMSEYYLPPGRWTSFFHPTRTIEGPMWVKEVVPIDEIPVWVRPDAVLCLGPPGIGRPDYDFADTVEVQVYELTESLTVEVEVPSGKGKEISGTIQVRKADGKVTVDVSSGSVGVSSVSLFSQGKVTRQDVAKGQKQVEVLL